MAKQYVLLHFYVIHKYHIWKGIKRSVARHNNINILYGNVRNKIIIIISISCDDNDVVNNNIWNHEVSS